MQSYPPEVHTGKHSEFPLTGLLVGVSFAQLCKVLRRFAEGVG